VRWLQIRSEQGCSTGQEINKAVNGLNRLIVQVRAKTVPAAMKNRQPNNLARIRLLRPRGPRNIKMELNNTQLQSRILGALLGRAAGCALGIPCEGMSKQEIKNAAVALGQNYPLDDYWKLDPCPHISDKLHYQTTPRKKFLKSNMGQMGADDDLVYTILGLLIVEDYGIDFTSDDVGKAWLKYLPRACTAEQVALENLRRGIRPPKTALKDNPYAQWIGAYIRSDPWAYIAPGLPELAAEFAYRDARLSHVMNGIYGEMFFSAAISAAFIVDNTEKAIRIGLSEIPRNCDLAVGIRKTLAWVKKDNDWNKTVERILKHYEDINWVHTVNNAAVTVAGLMYGNGNFERTIALTVMAGMDTDCTGATAGSIAGAMMGAQRLPKKWTTLLGDTVVTYLKVPNPTYRWTNLAKRFTKQAMLVWKNYGNKW